MENIKPFVVKIGGSLADTPRLTQILTMIASSKRPVVVVPGGGAFADTVRDLQKQNGFDDATAHGLALLAMHEMAKAYLGVLPGRLAPAETPDEILSRIQAGIVPVWLPYAMCEGDTDVPHDWTATSDALAARLAEILGGSAVVLVKAIDADRKLTAFELAGEGIVDAVFPEIVTRASLPWRVIGPGHDADLSTILGVPQP